MIKGLFKQALSALLYRPGTAHRILAGPMRGLWFKCSENTGLAALCSGNEKDNQRVYASVVRPGDTVVDVEGAERSILRFRPHLVVELHNPEQDMEVAALLRQWN